MNSKRIQIKHQPKIGKRQGQYVLYWMQASQRIHWNHALSYAVERANLLNLPLLVYFGLTDDFPEANERHYAFMLQGIEGVSERLKDLNIGFILIKESPEKGILHLLGQAAELVMDRGYLRIQKEWRQAVLESALKRKDIRVSEVESDVVVPVEVASIKEEYSARTIRPKIGKQLSAFIQEPNLPALNVSFSAFDLQALIAEIPNSMSQISWSSLLASMTLDRQVGMSPFYRGGERAAEEVLEQFIAHKLSYYLDKNHPEWDYVSDMSPYLHFGQISPVYIYQKVDEYTHIHPECLEAAEAFFEELIVRRELAINFVHYNEAYDQFEGMTYQWAYDTMASHRQDPRAYCYDFEAFDQAQTHDPYWNACMEEMKVSGKMHTYMRMYWCKKILEWTPDYQTAYEISKRLNNTYFIDGRDPLSFTGIAWCFGKHDRAWKERSIFGKLRYMNANGLERKFDMATYLKRVEQMKKRAKGKET